MSRDVTIYDIARALEISPATVSRGLKDHPGIHADTKKRIVEMARQMGYQHNTFARNLRLKRTNTLGVVIPRLNSYFMSTVIAGMEKVVTEKGYNLIINQSQESAKKEVDCVNTMYNSRVDGLLVSLAFETTDMDHFNGLLNKNVPVIFFDRVASHGKCFQVIIDNEKAGFDITRHLIDQGCQRIVHIGGNLRRNVYADRLAGYKKALQKAGIPVNPSSILINDLSEQAGIDAARQILKMVPLPDGIFAANDTSAVACISELKRKGIRVPDQIAVAGFNNDPISRVIEPNLTTIDYPGYAVGEKAAATLLDILAGDLSRQDNKTIILPHALIVRTSSLRKLPS